MIKIKELLTEGIKKEFYGSDRFQDALNLTKANKDKIFTITIHDGSVINKSQMVKWNMIKRQFPSYNPLTIKVAEYKG